MEAMLKKGVELFGADHPNVCLSYDITHKIACMYKRKLSENNKFSEFIEQVAQSKKVLQLSSESKLAPPNLRSKARLMNFDIVVGWGGVKTLKAIQGTVCPKIISKLGWIAAFKESIEKWEVMDRLAKLARNIVRKEGYSSQSAEKYCQEALKIKTTPDSEPIACELIDFLEAQGSSDKINGPLLGSSEIIESLFGSYKELAYYGNLTAGKLSRLILTLPALAGKITEDVVKQAMEVITNKSVEDFLKALYIY